jgi:hypothetical protein
LNLKKELAKTVDDFDYLEKSKVDKVSQKYTELVDRVKNDDFLQSVKELSSLLYAHHRKKVWILIDEYDAALNKAYLEFNDEEAK